MNKNVDILTKENIVNHIVEKRLQYYGLPEKNFQYKIGDHVSLKAMSTPEGREKNAVPGFKRSLGKLYQNSKIQLTYLFQRAMMRAGC